MAFLDDLGDFVKPITNKSKEVANKARDLTEALQIKSQITAEKTAMEEAFLSIGRSYYQTHQQCEDERYEDAYLVIESCKKQIHELEEKLHFLTGSRVCSHCGAKVDKEFLFCGRCGAPMECRDAEQREETESGVSPTEVLEIKMTEEADKQEEPKEDSADLL